MRLFSSLFPIVIAVLAACPAGGQDLEAAVGYPAAPPESIAKDAVPRFFPNYTTPCPSPTLDAIMKDRLNAALSQASVALFHAEDADRMERVADAAAVILGCAARLEEIRPAGLEERAWVAYDHLLVQLVVNTHALQTAALEDEVDDVVHWYHHVKQSCAACHARFREP